MGVFTDRLTSEVRMEHMRPGQLEEAVRRMPAVYAAFGSMEWHGRQNPLGLDATKGHEFLVGLAERIGGVVYPAVFFGSGGGHKEYPFTYMVDAQPMGRIVEQLLHGFQTDGFRAAVLLSGHYPNKREYLSEAAEAYRRAEGTMEVLCIIEKEAPGVSGDHASLWETSYQMYLHPRTVDLAVLGPPEEGVSGDDTRRVWMGEEFRQHPLYGLAGIDPRGRASAAIGAEAAEKLISHLGAWARGAVGQPG